MNIFIWSNARGLFTSLAVLVVALLSSPQSMVALDIKLADVVGGGNGTGTGSHGAGIDPSNGTPVFPGMYQLTQADDTNSYHPSAYNFVDGVFIPDGGAGSVTLDSAGHTYDSFPNTDSLSWDLIRNGANQNSGTTLNGIDYDAGAHSVIGLHANKGITFDVQEIVVANPGMYSERFTAVAGMSHVTGGYGTADWWVFVDGVLVQRQLSTPGGVGFAINVPLTSATQFLTLVSTNASDNFLVDQVIFGDPVLTLATVPEPNSLALAALFALGLLIAARRKQRCSAPLRS